MNKIWEYNDGGRKEAGFKAKHVNDCVTRAIAIATGEEYGEVYNKVNICCAMSATLKDISMKTVSSARGGVAKKIAKKLLKDLGFVWVPTMFIGQGCKVHLKADELPAGRIICATSHHYVAVIDGIIQDTYDPTRNGTRCVYGYYVYNPEGNLIRTKFTR